MFIAAAPGDPPARTTRGTVEKALFTITCTTCRARLAVRSAEVIGDIVECPKCGLMVEVRPPRGFIPPRSGDEPPPHGQQPAKPSKKRPPPRDLKPGPPAAPPVAAPVLLKPPKGSTTSPPPVAAPVLSKPPKGSAPSLPPVAAPVLSKPPKGSAPSLPPVAAPVPLKSPTAPPADKPAKAPLGQSTVVAAAFYPMPDEIPAPPIIRPGGWLGLLAHPMMRWLAMATAPLVGLGLVVGVWEIWAGRHSEPPAVTATQPAADAAVEQPPAEAETKAAQPATTSPLGRFDCRWLPDRTAWILSLRGVCLARQPQNDTLVGAGDPMWRASVGAVLEGLGLTLDRVERVTWAAADPAAWPQRSAVVVELAPGQDAAALANLGKPIDIGMSGLVCRQLTNPRWPHPIVVVDPRTVVTGDEAVLRALAQRGEARLESAALDRLLAAMSPDADALLLVDLAAFRAADGKLPRAMLDVWPAGKRAWRELWDMPLAVGFAANCCSSLRSEVALACQSETEAEMVRADLETLLAAAKEALPRQIESLQQALEAGRLTAAAADPYRQLLDDGRTALAAAKWQVADGTVLLRLNWARSPLAVAASAVAAAAAVQADWLAAAQKADEATQRRIVAGLSGHTKSTGSFPAGAVGGALLEPDTRLSWIAEMLPYYDHADWHRKLEWGYSWNSPQNGPISRRPLPEVVNPALGPTKTKAGFPVTHYVGVAGVGPDAGLLKADDPRGRVWLRPADAAGGDHRRGVARHRRFGRERSLRPLGRRRRRHGPPLVPGALCQRAGRLRQRSTRRHVGRHGRRFRAIPLQGRRSPRRRAVGDDSPRGNRRGDEGGARGAGARETASEGAAARRWQSASEGAAERRWQSTSGRHVDRGKGASEQGSSAPGAARGRRRQLPREKNPADRAERDVAGRRVRVAVQRSAGSGSPWTRTRFVTRGRRSAIRPRRTSAGRRWARPSTRCWPTANWPASRPSARS